jgi:tRNA (guanosine-2'-O-)-methyltransferase
MYGMVQSLNVSVATGVILYEAERQRQARGLYESGPHLSPEEMEAILHEWAYEKVIKEKARGRI